MDVTQLIDSLKDTDEFLTMQALSMLVEMGDDALDELIDGLSNSDKNVRKNCAKALGEISNPKSIDALIKALSDSNKWVRRESSSALSKMGSEAVEPLIQCLDDADWRVKGAAAWALGNLKDNRAVTPLCKLLDQDNNGFVKQGALSSLKLIDTPESNKALLKYQNE